MSHGNRVTVGAWVVSAFAALSVVPIFAVEPVVGDVAAYRAVQVAQQAAWEAMPHGYAKVNVEYEQGDDEVVTANYEVWWIDHDLVRWEGVWTFVGHDGVTYENRPFRIVWNRQEVFECGFDARGKISFVQRRNIARRNAKDWLFATPRHLWLTITLGRNSLAGNLKKLETSELKPPTVSRDGALVRFDFARDGQSPCVNEYDLERRGMLQKRTIGGVVSRDVEWILDEANRPIPTRFDWNTDVPGDPGIAKECRMRFEVCDLDVARDRQAFTIDGLGLPQGTTVNDMRGEVPRSYDYGVAPPADPLGAVKAAAEQVRGQGLGQEGAGK